MRSHLARTHIVAIGGLTALLLALPSLTLAGPKPEKRTSPSSASSSTKSVSPSIERHSNNKPGPAWRTIYGTLKHIKSHVYTVEDYEGNQIELYVSKETTHLSGNKKVGDSVRAEITRGRFANSIQ